MRYQITSFDYLRAKLAELNDDPAKHWSEYPCLLWERGKTPFGYGKFGHDNKLYDAHREAYKISIGPIPSGHLVCHHCDTPACFRPIHLFTGTIADNNRDMYQKGRGGKMTPTRGEAHGGAKLTTENVREIRRMCSVGVSDASLAKLFNVTPGCIWHITKGVAWKHVA